MKGEFHKMLANSTSPVAFTTEIRLRDVVEMYNAAERPQDLDEIIVKVPSVAAVSRALADRDNRANEFNSFLDGCVKPSDVTRTCDVFARPYSAEDDPENWEADEADIFEETDDVFVYGFVNPYGVACDLAKRWIAEGYSSIWLRSDKRVFKSRGMIGNGDYFRRGALRPQPNGNLRAPLTAERIPLTNKRNSGGAIANAIRLGQRIAEICEPVKISPKVAEPCVEIERIPVALPDGACPLCQDFFCECDEMGLIGRLAA